MELQEGSRRSFQCSFILIESQKHFCDEVGNLVKSTSLHRRYLAPEFSGRHIARRLACLYYADQLASTLRNEAANPLTGLV